MEEFGPQYIRAAEAVTVADLVREAHGRPDALTGIVLKRAKDALPEDLSAWQDWQKAFADSHSTRQAALRHLLDCIHSKLYGPQSAFEALVVEGIAQANETLQRVDDRQDALHKWLTDEQYAKASEIEGLKEQLASAYAQIEKMAAREGNRPSAASEALSEHDPDKGYDVLVAEAESTLEEGEKAATAVRTNSQKTAAATLRNAGALAFLNDTQDAFAAYRRATELDPDDMDGWNQLGLLLARIGKLEEAEQAYLKVGELADQQGDKLAEAVSLGNLGTVYFSRGDLDRAEQTFEESRALNAELGHKEGIASQYGNLGILYKTRGDLDRAEEAYETSLAIHIELGHKEGMANQYGNLGNLYWKRGDLDRAEEAYENSLILHTELGRKEGMANNYGNLGNLYFTRGDLDRAEETYGKSLSLNTELGRKEAMANQYGNLGILYATRGDLDRAEPAFKKSLALNTELGSKEGMANQYGNLGILYATRGDLDRACESWRKSRDLYAEIGIPHMVEKHEALMREAGATKAARAR
ncbi:MAG: tetratricopeptide repeat protein [Pseudomonadota bacterium]